MRVLPIFLVLTLAAACGPGASGYPDSYQFNFMQACEAQQDVEGLCACTWDKIEVNVPRRDFDALEAMTPEARAASPLQQQIQGYVLECAASDRGE